MKNVTIKDILECTGGTLLMGDADMKVEHLSTDSREIGESTLFVPIVGTNINGHDYVEKALMAGAIATLTAEEEVFDYWLDNHAGDERAFILVNNTTEAIQRIGKMARLKLTVPAVGITGSVGKTTTREMVAAALSAEKKVYKTDKNYNNWLGVPLTLSEMTDDDDIAVLELGLNVRGELGLISSLTNIETAVITNIGVAHIEFYGTQDEICKEKFTVTNGFFDENPHEKRLFLCGNDPYLMKHKDECKYPVTIYGSLDNAEYRAVNIHPENGKYCFDLYIRGVKRLSACLSVLGEHNVLNAVAALAVADHYGVDLDKAVEKLAQFTGFKNRLQRYEYNGALIIDDTYNASPASMKAGLDVLCTMEYKDNNGRRIAVLGDMFELGANAPQYHYEVGVYAASKKFDELILIGENAMEIKRALVEANSMKNVYAFADTQAITEALRKELKDGDIVYLKASNAMKLHSVTEGLIHG